MNDERLHGEGQRQAAEWVRALPEETPSLAWRSALNERVRAEAASRARGRWRWNVARPALGLALAAAFAVVVFVPRPAAIVAPPKSKGGLEASLVALHERSVETADVVGTGLAPSEVPASTATERVRDPLEDLEAL